MSTLSMCSTRVKKHVKNHGWIRDCSIISFITSLKTAISCKMQKFSTQLFTEKSWETSQTVVGLLRQEAWVKSPLSMAIFLTFVNNSKFLSFECMFWYWKNLHIYPYVCMYMHAHTCTHDYLWVHNTYASIYIVINYLPILCQLWKGFIAVSFGIGDKSVPT